ncbi:uncharacterized protein LOC135208722 [Macrobrachium nipponense]|uniref:uncharacterized protein LOC135208722 n=1 Tax=Macrobrachium nipponense TaxID=159736 RepID=UPI0030C8A129
MIRVAFLTMLSLAGSGALRVDDKPGFSYCKTPHLAQIDRIEVSGCNKWPCFIVPGRSGTYSITFTSNTDQVITNMHSSIYAWVRLSIPTIGKRDPTRVAMPGETKKPLCPFSAPQCPVFPGVQTTVTKSITIPPQARLAKSPMLVEFQIQNQNGQTVTCFRAPVIVG